MSGEFDDGVPTPDPWSQYLTSYPGGPVQRIGARVRLRGRTLADLRHAPRWSVVAIAVVLAAMATVPALSATVVGVIIDGLASDDVERAKTGVAFIIALLVLEQLAIALVTPVRELARTRIDEAIREELRLELSGLPGIEALEDQTVRDDTEVLTRWLGTWTYGEAVEGQIQVFFGRYVQTLLAAAVIARLSASLAAAVMVLVAIRWEYTMRMYRKGTAIVMGQVPLRRAARYWGNVAGRGDAAKELRTFGFGSWVVERQHRISQRMYQLSFDYVLHILPRQWPSFFLGGATVGLVGYVGVGMGVDGSASVAIVGAALAATMAAQWPATGEAPFAYEAARLIDGARTRVREIATAQTPGSAPPPSPPTPIEFNDVFFSYPGSDTQVLSGLDITIKRGESLAIVGENGSGKTTLIKLLAGLYEPTSGSIAVNGRSLTDIDLTMWRQQLAVIFQDFTRFELSVSENVGLAELGEVDDDRMVSAVEDAGASSFVDQLPHGTSTMLGRRYTGGGELSGGQWQRIALARALYALAAGREVLVMDEPTASLDIATELEVFDTVLDLAADATVILLSHRFSTVRKADRIVVLDRGLIIEDGSHADLMARDGVYARMFTTQASLYQGLSDV